MDEVEYEYLSLMLATDLLVPKPNAQFIEPDEEDEEDLEDDRASDFAEEYLVSLNAYYDRKGSLLASTSISIYPSAQLSINLYPDSFKWNDFGLGAYLILSDEGASSLGLTINYLPFTPGYRW
jgi:hypothetical protein